MIEKYGERESGRFVLVVQHDDDDDDDDRMSMNKIFYVIMSESDYNFDSPYDDVLPDYRKPSKDNFYQLTKEGLIFKRFSFQKVTWLISIDISFRNSTWLLTKRIAHIST